LADLLRQRTSVKVDFTPLSGDYLIPAETAILVNATSVGLGDADARLPVAASSWRPGLVVADVVFNPPQTWLIRTAADHGCQTLDGLGMLVNQAVISFEIWTGRKPDASVMRDALEEFLEI
jgi:shikimate dehydrogenase